ncbi:hypothetical protein LXA43DRAFT_713039 [Ganoderma leucocontextum]|nr:hypothetical protein LXA43DRAFT_713039 [Ganoderma leucocontextum]
MQKHAIVPTTRSLSDVQGVLFYIISPHLDPEQSSSEEDIFLFRQTLLRSALTCRNFTRPALTALWRWLPSDKPLISLLCTLGIAQDRVLLERGPPITTSYGLSALKDPRMHPNWTRFLEYAMRVRKICLNPSTDPLGVKWSIWTEVTQFIPDEPILPRLQSVDITSNDMFAPCTAPLLLVAPSVREMTVWLRGSNDDRIYDPKPNYVLSEACARAPHLQTIALSIIPWVLDPSFLHYNPHLRSVSIHSLLKMENLAPLTHLTELEYLSIIPHSIDIGNGVAPLYFPSLRALLVRSDWRFIEDLLDGLQAPHIHSLSLHVSRIDPRQAIEQPRRCLQTIATTFSTLEKLCVECAETPRHPSHYRIPFSATAPLDTRAALMAIIEPLLSLSRLRHVSLSFPIFLLRLASDDVHRLSEAWPDIEDLRIDIATVDRGRAGLESTVHFAHRCPRLRALRLPAMDLAVDAFEGLEYPAEPHLLRDLNVTEVLFPREADLSREIMATFIQRVFPNAVVPFAKRPSVVTDEESGDRSRLV